MRAGKVKYRLGYCFHLVQIELDVVEGCDDLNTEQLNSLFQALWIVFEQFLELISEDSVYCFADRLGVLQNWFRHAKGDHGPEWKIECVVFAQEVDTTEKKVEPEWKFLLAGRVECRQEAFREVDLLDVVHEDVEPIKFIDDRVFLVKYELLYFVDPGIKVHIVGTVEWLAIYLLFFDELVEFEVEQLKKVDFPSNQSAIDFDVALLGLFEKFLRQVCLAGRLLPVDEERGVGLYESN